MKLLWRMLSGVVWALPGLGVGFILSAIVGFLANYYGWDLVFDEDIIVVVLGFLLFLFGAFSYRGE